MARFVVVPQWQGSPSSRAMTLGDGAEAIAGDLPRAACTVVDVPLEAGESLGTGILRASSLARTRQTVSDVLSSVAEPVVTIGGDCGVSVPAVSHVAGDDLAVVWFDAHPDLHVPDTSPSGAFSGMALRAVLGEGAEGHVARTPISPDRAVLVGTRSSDPAEVSYIAERGLTVVSADALTSDPGALARAVAATGAARAYVHIDLDVLDPAEINGVTAPAPFGVSVASVVSAIAALRDVVEIAGATIAGFAPPSPADAVDDLGAILRLIGAVAR